jgi:hypothetical protein
MAITQDENKPVSLGIKITSPSDGAQLTGPSFGQPITINGAVWGNLVDLEHVIVTVGNVNHEAMWTINPAPKDDTWTVQVKVTSSGLLKIQARATGETTTGPVREEKSETPEIAVNVVADTTPPEITILAPTPFQEVTVAETGSTTVLLQVNVTDAVGIIKDAVKWRLDYAGVSTSDKAVPDNAHRWIAYVPLYEGSFGPAKIIVSASDFAGNAAQQDVTVVAKDGTPPHYDIFEPKDDQTIIADSLPKNVKVSGRAWDDQSGVFGGQAKVEWSLDGKLPFTLATPAEFDDWNKWQAQISIPNYGTHSIALRLTDAVGNSVTRLLNLQVVSFYQPKEVGELLSPRAYLQVLLAFAANHVTLPGGESLTAQKLEGVCSQPFGKLAQPLFELGSQPVNQLRVAIEVLRAYLKEQPKLLAAHWTFDEGRGSVANDSSGNNNAGIIWLPEPARWVTGKVGTGAFSFDGLDTNDRIQVRDSPSLQVGENGSDFSVAFWLYLRAGGNGNWRLVMRKGDSDQDRTFAIFLRPDDNRVYFRISTDENPDEGENSITPIPLKSWTHIAYVKRESELGLYLNGVLDARVALTGTSITNPGSLWIGGDEFYHGFAGSLDDLRIYNLALSDESIKRLVENELVVPVSEEQYRQAAYETLLRRTGTSYEEIRLARGADEKTRQALAERLGIRLGAARPDRLDALYLAPKAITEAALEELFGLVDTTSDPLDSSHPRLDTAGDPLDPSIRRPQLLQWQFEALKARWMGQDFPTGSATDGLPPLIDPDLIAADDIRNPVPSNAAFDLWDERRQWVEKVLGTLQSQRQRARTVLEAFDEVAGYTLGDASILQDLETRYKSGKDIEPDLKAAYLTMQTLTRLLRIRSLAESGVLTDAEWEDVLGILVQVGKSREYANWREAEKAGGIALMPEFFKIAPLTKALPSWRATSAARRKWQGRLQARIDQQVTMVNALRAGMEAAEEATLPLLRDALIVSIAGHELADQLPDWLTEWLLTDLKASSSQKTTRVLQAVETIQGLLFSLRTSRFGVAHPASQWKLNQADQTPKERDEHFDNEWRWMGTHATWRAAMSVFLYPENFLLPSLREAQDRTPEFDKLLEAVRAKPTLSPQEARDQAQAYLRSLPFRNLTAQWKFEENNGDTATDATGGGADGKLHKNATWETVGGRKALRFQELEDYVQIDHTPVLEVGAQGADFSVALWLSLNQGPTKPIELWRGIIHKGAKDAERTFAMWMRYDDNRVYYRISTTADPDEGNSSTAQIELNDPNEPNKPKWTYIAYVKKADELQLYLNGKLDSSVKLKGASVSNTGPIYLGKDPWYDAGIAGGAIADVRIYHGALSAAEVSALHDENSFPGEVSWPLALTDQLSNTELAALGEASRKALEDVPPHGRFKPEDLPYLKEIFYFVPMQLALQLQKAGEYTAALDWFQTVYAYNLPLDQRKVYYGLKLEQNRPPDLSTGPHWLKDSPNPHTIAANQTHPRPNPYTRFTLMNLARCFLDFADSEFTRDTGESLSRALSLYMTTRSLLKLPDLELPQREKPEDIILPNPVLEALRLRAETQLAKIRQGRNIAGMKRVLELSASPQTVGTWLPEQSAVLRPTPYHYRILIERSKQLVSLAQQMEATYLTMLEKLSDVNYRRFQANQGLDLANAGVALQVLRVTEAASGETLAQKQQERADFLSSQYTRLINAGLNEHEKKMIDSYWDIKTQQDMIAGIDAAIGAAQFSMQAAGLTEVIGSGGARVGIALAGSAAYAARAITTGFMNYAQASIQANALYASQERRVDEWNVQKGVADKDSDIAAQQILMAQDHSAVVGKEAEIAGIQQEQAKAMVEFLDNQFLNAELYEWMSGVLARVYGYFLQQATGTAKLAQNQLAFERQEVPPAFIQADYWQPSVDIGSKDNGNTQDRRGLTGSARLLQDIYQLDQYAFETDRRKLNLTQTFSLAQLVPFEFQQFRETGVLHFATPMHLFDQAFPGQYLRLIKRVRTSVVALIPPTQGIRATLTASGISRVVIGDLFQETVVRRDPEMVALTSPMGATGVFELDVQSDMLLPFESMGVDTAWELQLPRASNPFDFKTIADVLVTIEYTALHSFDYRQQVIQKLSTKISADRSFSFRQHFADAWYDLHYPDQTGTPMVVRFSTSREDFPPNLEDLGIQHVLLYLARTRKEPFAVPVIAGLHFTYTTPDDKKVQVGGEASSEDGLYSTRGNASSWASTITDTDKAPVGEWELALPDTPDMRNSFKNEEIEDILFVITYSGNTPQWPA